MILCEPGSTAADPRTSVFVAIGLWHGAGWNVVVYGLLHDSLVAFGHLRDQARVRAGGVPVTYRGRRLALRVGCIFVIVVLTRLLFRSSDLEMVRVYVAGLFRASASRPWCTWLRR